MKKCPCCGKVIYNYVGKNWTYKIIDEDKHIIYYCSYNCFKEAGGTLEKSIRCGTSKDSYPNKEDKLFKLKN